MGEFFNQNGVQTSGINIGVCVLEPSQADFEVILKEVDEEVHVEHQKTSMPEQDYLTRFYIDRWHALGVHFNYQPHQVAFTDRKGLENCSRLVVHYEDLYVVHFSAKPKPRDCLINSQYAGIGKKNFAERALLPAYLRGLKTDSRRGAGHSARGRDAIEAQLRAIAWAGCGEWFQVWDRLVARDAELQTMVDDALNSPRSSEPHRRRRSSGSEVLSVQPLPRTRGLRLRRTARQRGRRCGDE